MLLSQRPAGVKTLDRVFDVADPLIGPSHEQNVFGHWVYSFVRNRMTCDPLCGRGELSMSTAQGVSRGFRRLGIFLAAIAFLVVGTVLFGAAHASLSNPIAQTPVGVRPEAPYACAVKGTQYA